MSMRTEEARPVRLEDYRPPDWLVETVELDVSLDPAATRVRATLMLAPNGNGTARADEPGSGRVSGARTIDSSRWPLASLASATAAMNRPTRSASPYAMARSS